VIPAVSNVKTAKCSWCHRLFTPSAALPEHCSPAHAAVHAQCELTNRWGKHMMFTFDYRGYPEEYMALFRAVLGAVGAADHMTLPEVAALADDLANWGHEAGRPFYERYRMSEQAAKAVVPSKRTIAPGGPKVVPFNRTPDGAR
jgi:hypothetical protein